MKKLLLVIIILSSFKTSFSQKTLNGGTWNTANNWTPNGVPTSSDDVIIPDGQNLVIDIAAVCRSLTLGSGKTSTTISFNTSTSLTINGALTIQTVTNQNGQIRSHDIIIGAASINCGSLVMQENEGDELSTISISTGTLTVRGDITMNSTTSLNQINITSTGRINIKGNFNANGSFSPGTTSTIAYNGVGNQNIRSGTYPNLIIDSTGIKSLVGNTIVDGTLTLTSGSLGINGNTLTLNNTVSRTAGFIRGSNTSNLTVAGTAANASLFFDQTNQASRSLSNLTNTRTNGINISNALEIIDSLNVSNGAIASGGNITLVSTSTKTARVARISSGSISGNVIVQRFIPGGVGKRKWRFLSFPVNNGSGGMPISQYIDDIHVTGTGGTTNGFDNCSGCGASLRTYTESLSGASNIGWTEPATINEVIPTGTGFEVFVRGDRNTVVNPFTGTSVPTDVTIDYTGVINSGNYNFNLSYTNTGNTAADGFNLVANPYPSQIDWAAGSGWTRTNINAHAYVYDANTGGYGTVSTSGVNGVGAAGMSRYIPSGQAFFVKANAASPAISMTEAVKVTNTPFNFFKNSNVSSSNLSYAQFKLIAPNYEDNFVIRLDSAVSDSAKDLDDAVKFFNDRLNFYTKSQENINLSINHFPNPKSINVEDTINVSVFSYNDSTIEYRTHRIELGQTVNLDGDIRFDLMDHYTNERIPLSTIGWYNFAIDTNTSSYGNNRFDIIVYRVSTGLEQEKVKKLISIFPNPASDQIFFGTASNNQEEVKVSILNLQGQLISEEFKLMNSENSYSNLTQLTEGVYFLKIEGKKFNETHKFIKTK